MKLVNRYILRIIAIAAILLIALWLALLARESSFFQEMVATYGYLGILLVSFASGFNLIVPVPAISFLPLYLEGGLNFWLVLILMTTGMTAADSVGYLLGRLGREVATDVDKGKVVAFFNRIQVRHELLAPIIIFLYASTAPLPNEVLVIPLGFMRFRFTLLFPLLLAGNFIFNLLGAYGVISIFNFLM